MYKSLCAYKITYIEKIDLSQALMQFARTFTSMTTLPRLFLVMFCDCLHALIGDVK